MAQYITLQGVNFSGVTGIKRDTQSETDKLIAAMPHLAYVLDPEKLSSTGTGKEAMNGIPLVPNTVTVTASALFGGRKVINFDANADKVIIDQMGAMPESFTIIMEVSGDSTVFDANRDLISSAGTASTDQAGGIRSAQASRTLRFYPDGRGGTYNAMAEADFATGVRHVLALSYDKATSRSTFFLNNPYKPLQTMVHSPVPDILPTTTQRIAIGGRSYSTSLGWRGQVGKTFIFSKALDSDDFAWLRERSFAYTALS